MIRAEPDGFSLELWIGCTQLDQNDTTLHKFVAFDSQLE